MNAAHICGYAEPTPPPTPDTAVISSCRRFEFLTKSVEYSGVCLCVEYWLSSSTALATLRDLEVKTKNRGIPYFVFRNM